MDAITTHGIDQPMPEVRRIAVADATEALRRGWEDFRAIPTQLIFLCVLYPVIGLVASRMAFEERLLPLLFPLAAGFALLGPILALGIYELSRRRERGEPVSALNVFDVLRSPALFGIAVLGAVLLAIFVAWLGAAKLIYDATVGQLGLMPFDLFMGAVFSTPEGISMLLVGNAVGFVFALLVLVISAVSFPLMLDRNVSPGVAIRTSLRAFAVNPVPMAAWGLIVALVLIAGMIPVFVGLAVALPVLGHATWHLYRRLIA